MNKPVIQGTKKHSALLKAAKAEQTRTHGGDPSLVEAANLYGASNSPDVIDYKIKQAEIKWDKKKKKKKKTTNNDNKKIIAEEDKNKAIDKLITNAGADDTEGQDENKQFDSEGNEITAKKKDTPGQYYERGSQERVGLPSAKNLVEPTNVHQEDIDLGRVIMTEDGYREAKWWTKQKKKVSRDAHAQDISPPAEEHLTKSEWLKLGTEEEKEKKVVEKKKVKKKVKKTTVKSEKKAEEGKSQKRNMGKQSDVVGTIDGMKVTNSDIGELRRIARSSQNFREKMEAKKKLDRLQKN